MTFDSCIHLKPVATAKRQHLQPKLARQNASTPQPPITPVEPLLETITAKNAGACRGSMASWHTQPAPRRKRSQARQNLELPSASNNPSPPPNLRATRTHQVFIQQHLQKQVLAQTCRQTVQSANCSSQFASCRGLCSLAKEASQARSPSAPCSSSKRVVAK